jgi:anti-anti-sigma regulatory factor
MQQSPAANDIATRTLAGSPTASVVFDLSACEYLDSTFLGILIDLYRRFGRVNPPRYLIAAPQEDRKRLLGAMHLERLIPMLDTPPDVTSAWVTIADRNLVGKDLIRHVMEAHRALAQTDCPLRDVFARIADQMEKELNA